MSLTKRWLQYPVLGIGAIFLYPFFFDKYTLRKVGKVYFLSKFKLEKCIFLIKTGCINVAGVV